METRRSTRERKGNINYKTLSNKGFANEESEEELDYNSDTMDFEIDSEGERELCGGSDNETEEEVEEGEIEDSENETDMEEQIRKCVDNGDLKKLKGLLKKQEEENRKLRLDLKREQEREKQKTKEMKDIVQKLQAAQKTGNSLRKSIASSRNASRNATPKVSPKKRTNKNSDHRIVKKRTGTKQNKDEDKKRGEYSDTLYSFLKLKQNKDKSYPDMVMSALEATDHIFEIKENRESKQTVVNRRAGNKKAKINKRSDCKVTSECERNTNESDMEEAIENMVRKLKVGSKGENTMDTLIEAMRRIKIEDKEIDWEPMSQEEASQLLTHLTKEKKTKETATDRVMRSLINMDEAETVQKPTRNIIEEDTIGNGKKNKLTSGKCTKPDEADIQQVVKFAHEKLDSRHVKGGHLINCHLICWLQGKSSLSQGKE